MDKKHLILLLGVVAALALSITLSAQVKPNERVAPTPHTQTRITWNPSSLVETVSPGQSPTVSVSFTASKYVSSATIEISPTLSQFVFARPDFFEHIPKGETRTFELVMSPPMGVAPGTASGTVQLRKSGCDRRQDDCDQEGKVLADQLPLVVNIWNSYTNSQLHLQIAIPPLGQPTQAVVTSPASGQSKVEIQLWDPTTKQFFPQFELLLYTNPTSASLQDWFEKNVDIDGILAANNTFRPQQLGNGQVALVQVSPIPLQYAELNGPVFDAYVLSPTGGRVLAIAQSQVNTLFNLGYTQTSITTLEMQILGSAQF